MTLDVIRAQQKTSQLVIGSHHGIIQSMVDFDFLCGKGQPNIQACVSTGKKLIKVFWGRGERLIPCYPSIEAAYRGMGECQIDWMVHLQSSRRVLDHTRSFFSHFPTALGGVIFAENVSERQATTLIKELDGRYTVFGPSSVGLLLPGHLKLGAIGGIEPDQILKRRLVTPGSVAVVSTSGGMTNELITLVAGAGKSISFAAAIGGDRFPFYSVKEVTRLLQADSATEAIVYFGELGGRDEYELIDAVSSGELTKPVIAYIAGRIGEYLPGPTQFGHAKSLAKSPDEGTTAKRQALQSVGVITPGTLEELVEAVKALTVSSGNQERPVALDLTHRRHTLFTTRKLISTPPVSSGIREPFTGYHRPDGLAAKMCEILLGRPARNEKTIVFCETVLALLLDHGAEVSGGVNTMVTARAGKDLVSSLCAGLLTIGPRFGGAIGLAAETWILAAEKGVAAYLQERVEGELIPGIGHRKYRLGCEDPRVRTLAEYADALTEARYYRAAREVESAMLEKSGSLILNVDGAVAALLLDILAEWEGFSREELGTLSRLGFFDAFFVLSRSVGFVGHFLEQKKQDEGLFRLPEDLLFIR